MSAAHCNILSDALGYLDRGTSCIAVAGKHPLISWKRYADSLPARSDLREWFANPSATGVAIIAGKASGALAVRDFDQMAGYHSWAKKYPTLAGTLPTAKTSRGMHVYCESNLARTIKLGDGEYRGRGLIIAPHSVHPSKARYEWIKALPAGRLPFVEHSVFTQGVTETAECHSVVSAISALSVTSLSVDQVLASTQPGATGERNSMLMNLARGLKFNAGLVDTSPPVLREIVRRWYQQALQTIATKDFDTTWADFIHAYERARYPLGENPVDAAALTVDPHDLPDVAADYSSENTRQVIGLCWAMAKKNDGKFFLSTHDLAARLKSDAMTVWRLMMMLDHDGVIKCVERGNKRKANRYRWIGGRQ